MKTIPANLSAHYASGGTSVAYAIFIERRDGELFGFTSLDSPLTLNLTSWGYAAEAAFVFDSRQGLDASALVTTAGLNVDNLELKTLDDGSLFGRDEILAGLWNNASFRIFRYRWDVSPVLIENHVETLQRGTFGEIKLTESKITIELRGLAQRLQQPIGIVSQKTCRSALGAVGSGKCNKDLSAFTHTFAVTSVTSKRVFSAGAATQADDYFGEGEVLFTTGANKSIPLRVRSFSAGTFTLTLPVVLDIQVGDTFTAVAGCRKRLIEDCRDKFANVLNFQGEPHRPTLDDLSKV